MDVKLHKFDYTFAYSGFCFWTHISLWMYILPVCLNDEALWIFIFGGIIQNGVIRIGDYKIIDKTLSFVDYLFSIDHCVKSGKRCVVKL